jgi:putative tricarboxylic transport membrane protein
MADENLRRALMVSQGSFMPVFTRPVSIDPVFIIVWTIVSQFEWYRKTKNWLGAALPGHACEDSMPGKDR